MPDSPHTNRGAAFETLFEAPAPRGSARGGALPDKLRRYGDQLAIPLREQQPTVLVNFVSSLDGVITVDPRKGNGAEISGFNEPDRFVMGLLRTLADVIIVGAGTVRAAGAHEWTPRRVHRGYADAYAAWRRELGLAPQPTTIVITATGEVPADHPAVSTEDVPVVVVTTRQAEDEVTRRLPTRVRIHASDRGDRVTANAIEAVLRDVGARVALCEGGPHLAGTLLDGGLVDELFLTLAPQVLGRGRDADRRLSLVAGTEFDLDEAPWARLMSVRKSVDHLFLRYGFERTA